MNVRTLIDIVSRLPGVHVERSSITRFGVGPPTKLDLVVLCDEKPVAHGELVRIEPDEPVTMTVGELIAELSTRDPNAEAWVRLNVCDVVYDGIVESVAADGALEAS